MVAGIGLPVLMLLGLQRGLIEKFRADILSSSTACEVKVNVTQADKKIGRIREDELEREDGIDLVIPDITRVIEVEAATGVKDLVTLQCTKPRGPAPALLRRRCAGEGRHSRDCLGKAARRSSRLTLSPVRWQIRGQPSDSYHPQSDPFGASDDHGRDDHGSDCSGNRPVRNGPVDGEHVRHGLCQSADDGLAGGFRAGAVRPRLELAGIASRPRRSTRATWPSTNPSTVLRTRMDYEVGGSRPHVWTWATRGTGRGGAYGLLKPHSLFVYWVRRYSPEDEKAGRTSKTSRVDVSVDDVERITDADDVVLPWSDAPVLKLEGLPIGWSVYQFVVFHGFENNIFAIRQPSSTRERQRVKPAIGKCA